MASSLHEERFRAMGTDVHVVVVGGGGHAADRARAKIDSLEARWSRFREDSDVSRLNAASGEPVRVSGDTMRLLQLAIEGREATGGLFDPTVLPTMVAIGYDRSFDRIVRELARAPVPMPHRSGSITVDIDEMTAAVAAGSGFDPGGIGKGLAADMVCEELIASRGVRGACVNIGGDLRVAGEPPDRDAWIVDVEHPFGWERCGRIALREGAVATTTRMKRRWVQAGLERHHVVDPRTGLPVAGGLASATIVAGEAWWAEVVAKAVFVAGASDARTVAIAAEVEGIAVDDDGALIELGENVLVDA